MESVTVAPVIIRKYPVRFFSLEWHHLSIRAFQTTSNLNICSTVFVDANNKENIKAPHYWAHCEGIHRSDVTERSIMAPIIKFGVKLLIHSQTSTVQPLKFGNG